VRSLRTLWKIVNYLSPANKPLVTESMAAFLIKSKYSFRAQMSNCRVRSIHSGALTVAGPRDGDGEIDGKYHVGYGQGDTTSKIIPLLRFEYLTLTPNAVGCAWGSPPYRLPFGNWHEPLSAFVPCGGPHDFLTRCHALARATVNARQIVET